MVEGQPTKVSDGNGTHECRETGIFSFLLGRAILEDLGGIEGSHVGVVAVLWKKILRSRPSRLAYEIGLPKFWPCCRLASFSLNPPTNDKINRLEVKLNLWQLTTATAHPSPHPRPLIIIS